MPEPLITENLHYFLKSKEFLYMATANKDGRPSVAPKFLIKAEDDHIYLADFVLGRAYENLKINPRVSVSVINREDLVGYQMNGHARILENGAEFDAISKDLNKREAHFSAGRIIERVQQDKKSSHFEVAFPKRYAVFKIEIEEIVNIESSGKLKRNKKINL
jgi:predicted pyridoxine 5'-phosphate oxidase superfamily flavin-nucleotide-binding protein